MPALDADELCSKWGLTVRRRIKKILFMPRESTSDAGFEYSGRSALFSKRNSG
jgi:hypothetical protein